MNSVTVLMPVRNGSYFLRDSIQCIEANTTLEDEIIVIKVCISPKGTE